MVRDVLLQEVDALVCRGILPTRMKGRCVCSAPSARLVKEIAAEVRYTTGLNAGSAGYDQVVPLELLGPHLRAAGDPDWRISAAARDSYIRGVVPGVDARPPRAPSVFDRKTKWRMYEDFGLLHSKDNYQSCQDIVDAGVLKFQAEAAEDLEVGPRLGSRRFILRRRAPAARHTGAPREVRQQVQGHPRRGPRGRLQLQDQGT